MGDEGYRPTYGYDPDKLAVRRSRQSRDEAPSRVLRSPASVARAPHAPETILRDLQSLLGDAARNLRDLTGAQLVAAWALREDATPYVAAASFSGTAPIAPDSDLFAAAADLEAACDLTDPALDDTLHELARHADCHAAAPVITAGGSPLCVLILKAGSDAPRNIPRHAGTPGIPSGTLSELATTARRLAGPLSAALAAGHLRALDERVRHLDRQAAIGELTTEIAHEVRNPLVSLKTFLQLLPERRSDPEFLDQFCEVVDEELQRMERLLDTLVDYGSPRVAAGLAGEPTPEESAEVRADTEAGDTQPPPSVAVRGVLETVELFLRGRAQLRSVTLFSDAHDALPDVRIEEDRLRQVVVNLTLNAIDATPAGGAVRLEAKARGAEGELRVSDEGAGVPEPLRERIFEPFFSTRADRPGGLGLSITRRIAEEAGGSIEVGDAPGGGATFCVRLPAVS